MIRKVIEKQPKQWHRYLPALLFAVRELPNASTTFSPFELMFGRSPRGPIDLLANTWMGGKDAEEAKTVYQYVTDLKNHIYDACQTAHDEVDEARKTQKFYHDKKALGRKFKVGDQVLLLLATTANKLTMQWKGPYEIVEVCKNDYKIDIQGSVRLYHANMLKKYYQRPVNRTLTALAQEPKQQAKKGEQNRSWREVMEILRRTEVEEVKPSERHSPRTLLTYACAAVLMEEDDVGTCDIKLVETPELGKTTTSIKDIHIDENLSEKQKKEMIKTFKTEESILTETPGASKGSVKHSIRVTTKEPTRRKPYPVPFAAQEELQKQTKELLDWGVIEPSDSPYCSPIVMVPKKDSDRKRMCLDLRQLNLVTVFDAEPMPDQEAIFAKIAHYKYFTKLDLSKGYYQIWIKEEDRHKTAFQTPLGLMQFTRVPFGLVSAPATFARAMRELVGDLAINFFDDILIGSVRWEDHIRTIKQVLRRLKDYGFTINPKKIHAGFQELEFLGHIVGHGNMKPTQEKVKNIVKLNAPKTKKEVRQLMGTMGYYKKFIPAYSETTAPITDLLQGKQKGAVKWTEQCQTNLDKIQELMSSGPILKLPVLDEPFTVRTDASDHGIGGVLLQEHDGLLHPVAFASRKLLDRETRYATIERECLGIVWTIGRFQRYLWGKEFALQTDHKPLQYLTATSYKNPRIMRWSLMLQEFRFKIEAVPGKDNDFADYMSRSRTDQMIP